MEQLIKSLKKPIWQDGDVSKVAMGRHAIEQAIPHRPPFLLIDKITAFDIAKRLIKGERYLVEDDPVFLGHYPGYPVYPGVLQIEMMGQLVGCLIHLIHNNTSRADRPNRPVMGLLTKVHHASFQGGIFPGQHLTIYGKLVELNELVCLVAGQIFCAGKLCSYCILESVLK